MKFHDICVALALLMSGSVVSFAILAGIITASGEPNTRGSTQHYAISESIDSKTSEPTTEPTKKTIEPTPSSIPSSAPIVKKEVAPNKVASKTTQKTTQKTAPKQEEAPQQSVPKASSDSEPVKRFKEALKYYPEDAYTNFTLSQVLLSENKFDECIKYLLIANRIEPYKAYDNYSDIIARGIVLKKIDFARRVIKIAIANDPKNTLNYTLMEDAIK
jgi:hypothetical protein